MSSILPTWRPEVPPGVYARGPRNTRGTPTVRMDIPAFVGLAQRGPVREPVVIDSWQAFLVRFGPPGGNRLLPECVSLFFAGGGARCVVVRQLDAGSTLSYAVKGFDPEPRLHAATPGQWLAQTAATVRFSLTRVAGTLSPEGADVRNTGSGLQVGTTLRLVAGDGVQSLHRVVAVTPDGSEQLLTLDPPAGAGLLERAHEVRFDLEVDLPGAGRRRFPALALDPNHPDHPSARLASDPDLDWPDASVLVPVSDGRRVVLDEGFRTVPRVPFAEQHAAERPDLVTREGMLAATAVLDGFDAANPTAPTTMVHLCDLVHVDEAHRVEEATSITVPVSTGSTFVPCDAVPQVAVPARSPVYPLLHWRHDSEQIAHIQRRLAVAQEGSRRIALLDVPPHLPADRVARWRHGFETDRAAAFGPWLVVAGAGDPGSRRTIPPGGAVAGIWASTVRASGVGWAPANRVLARVLRLFEGQQLPAPGVAHGLHVNLIRSTPAGYTLLGARSLSTHPDWVHVHVRRLMDWLAMQLPVDHAWAVFEPNDRQLVRRIGLTLRRRLLGMYEADALQGATAEQAFFFDVDPASRATDQDAGVLRIRVGVCPSVPMEFLVVELLLDTGGQRVEVRDV